MIRTRRQIIQSLNEKIQRQQKQLQELKSKLPTTKCLECLKAKIRLTEKQIEEYTNQKH
jgi:hypothetical protein